MEGGEDASSRGKAETTEDRKETVQFCGFLHYEHSRICKKIFRRSYNYGLVTGLLLGIGKSKLAFPGLPLCELLLPVTVRVLDYMDRKVVFLESSKTVADAIRTMMDESVWSCVATREGLPVGVVGEHEIILNCYGKNLDAKATKLESVMSSPIITIKPDASIGDALALMVEQNIQRAFVVDKGKIVGRVTHTDILRGMLNLMLALSSPSR